MVRTGVTDGMDWLVVGASEGLGPLLRFLLMDFRKRCKTRSCRSPTLGTGRRYCRWAFYSRIGRINDVFLCAITCFLFVVFF
jgi:hypothetical protein